MKENFRIHGEISVVTADQIFDSATSSRQREVGQLDNEEEVGSDDSCQSEDYLPNRARSYSVKTVSTDGVNVSHHLN